MMGGTAPSPLRPGRPTRPKVAVIHGGDALRPSQEQSNARAIRGACDGLGYESIAIPLGREADAHLLGAEADLVVSAALDSRLDGGEVPELCEALGLPFVGASAGAFRKVSDKALCAASLADAGITVPKQRIVSRGAIERLGLGAALPLIVADLGPAVIVKPLHGAAGCGVRHAKVPEEVPGAVLGALSYDDAAVIEPVVQGSEYTVLVVGDSWEQWAAGIAAVATDDGGDPARTAAWSRSYHPVPPNDGAVQQRVALTARRAAGAIGCTGLATVDLIVDEHGVEWVIDVDCQVDWTPGGRLTACLASNDLNELELLASLLAEPSPRAREAA